MKILLLFIALITSACLGAVAGNLIPVSAPMTTDLTGKTMDVAYPSVFRLMCKGKGQGTGFLHRSGRVITALHVVQGCPIADITILDFSGKAFGVTNMVTDTNSDLALLMPAEPIKAASLPLATNITCKIGAQVCTWGFPGGYTGLQPLLSAGYFSGLQWEPLGNGITRPMLVVNAAFNGGNSGGPLVDIETGQVIGVVTSKLAPLPPEIEQEIALLKREPAGMVWEATFQDGTKKNISEAQVTAEIIEYLRSQVQLVIGYAATSGNVGNFLKSQGIDP